MNRTSFPARVNQRRINALVARQAALKELSKSTADEAVIKAKRASGQIEVAALEARIKTFDEARGIRTKIGRGTSGRR